MCFCGIQMCIWDNSDIFKTMLEPVHEILVLIAYAWVKVQNLQNPEL